MTLEDYADGDANVSDLDPDFAGRVLELCDFFGGRLTIDSGYRSNAEQWVMFRRYGYPRAAYPGTSNHERGLAVDFAVNNGLTWVKVHAEAPRKGIRFPHMTPGGLIEEWHAEPDPTWQPEEDDMPYTPDQIKELVKEGIAEALGTSYEGADVIVDGGVVKMKLNDGQYWSLGDVLEFIHRQTK